MSPPATELDVRLWDAAVTQEQPEPEHRLGQDVKNGIRHDLAVDGSLAGAIGEAPDAEVVVSGSVPDTSRRWYVDKD